MSTVDPVSPAHSVISLEESQDTVLPPPLAVESRPRTGPIQRSTSASDVWSTNRSVVLSLSFDRTIFFRFRIPRAVSIRQRAEIQLEGLLNEPELSLPVSIRRASDHLADERISIEQASKLLNTQPFIIERLANSLYSTFAEEKRSSLSKAEVQKLTRALNGPIDVRSLLFFMMLDENNDRFVTQQELSQFYNEYLKALKTFDSQRQQEFVDVLSQKFQLNQPVGIELCQASYRTYLL